MESDLEAMLCAHENSIRVSQSEERYLRNQGIYYGKRCNSNNGKGCRLKREYYGIIYCDSEIDLFTNMKRGYRKVR